MIDGLRDDEIIIVTDFSMNYAHVPFDQVN